MQLAAVAYWVATAGPVQRQIYVDVVQSLGGTEWHRCKCQSIIYASGYIPKEHQQKTWLDIQRANTGPECISDIVRFMLLEQCFPDADMSERYAGFARLKVNSMRDGVE